MMTTFAVGFVCVIVGATFGVLFGGMTRVAAFADLEAEIDYLRAELERAGR